MSMMVERWTECVYRFATIGLLSDERHLSTQRLSTMWPWFSLRVARVRLEPSHLRLLVTSSGYQLLFSCASTSSPCFPTPSTAPLQASILGRALSGGIASVELHDIRDYAHDKHQVVDDYAYGGGPGMVMKPEPLARGDRGGAGDGRAAGPRRADDAAGPACSSRPSSTSWWRRSA